MNFAPFAQIWNRQGVSLPGRSWVQRHQPALLLASLAQQVCLWSALGRKVSSDKGGERGKGIQ